MLHEIIIAIKFETYSKKGIKTIDTIKILRNIIYF